MDPLLATIEEFAAEGFTHVEIVASGRLARETDPPGDDPRFHFVQLVAHDRVADVREMPAEARARAAE